MGQTSTRASSGKSLLLFNPGGLVRQGAVKVDIRGKTGFRAHVQYDVRYSDFAKIILLIFRKVCFVTAIPPRWRGAFWPIVTNVRRGAVDAGGVGANKQSQGGSYRERRQFARNDHAVSCVRQNRVVLAPGCWRQALRWRDRPDRAVSPAIREATVATELVSPGRARHKPSTHRAGKAGLFPAEPVCSCAFSF